MGIIISTEMAIKMDAINARLRAMNEDELRLIQDMHPDERSEHIGNGLMFDALTGVVYE